MKKILFGFAVASVFIACSKDDNDDTQVSSTDKFECTIDGKAHSISGKFAFADKISEDLFGIYGSEDQTKSGFKNVYISLPKEPSVGSYDLSKNENGSGNILETSSGTLYNTNFPGGSGNLTITEKTESRIKGTFEFDAVSPTNEHRIVKAGKFDVPIQ
jgi:Family of unknown function (DUF6252)